MFYDSSFSPSGVRVFIEKKAQLTLLGTEWDLLKTNYPVAGVRSTQTSKEHVAVEKALTFDSSGLLGPQESCGSSGA